MGVAAAGSEVEKNLIVRGGACEPPAKREMAPNPWNTGIEMIYSENRQKGKNRLSAT